MNNVLLIGFLSISMSFSCYSQRDDNQLTQRKERIELSNELISSGSLDSIVFARKEINGMAQKVSKDDELKEYISKFTIYFGESAFRVDEEPFSMSGDWYERHSHYFDSDGSTIGYEFNSSTPE